MILKAAEKAVNAEKANSENAEDSLKLQVKSLKAESSKSVPNTSHVHTNVISDFEQEQAQPMLKAIGRYAEVYVLAALEPHRHPAQILHENTTAAASVPRDFLMG